MVVEAPAADLTGRDLVFALNTFVFCLAIAPIGRALLSAAGIKALKSPYLQINVIVVIVIVFSLVEAYSMMRGFPEDDLVRFFLSVVVSLAATATFVGIASRAPHGNPDIATAARV